jgi:hypothetical protein
MNQRSENNLSDLSSSLPSGLCCNPYRFAPERVGSRSTYKAHPIYDERALAEDLNSLTFEQRQQIDEEIHGVADEVRETPEFIAGKLQAMRDEARKLPLGQRKAYDRAVFLRPQIETDDSFHLMFLRAKRFVPEEAACLMAIYFQSKLELFGEALLVQHITWVDMTPQDQEFVRSGGYLHLRGKERKGRIILYSRVFSWDLSDPMAIVRGIWYVNSAIESDPEQQRRGAVVLFDLMGQSTHSLVEIVRFFAMVQKHVETILFRVDSVHILYDNPALNGFFKSLFGVIRQDFRLRHRCHFGSNLEIQYSLRTFGIDIKDCVGPGIDAVWKEIIQRQWNERLRAEEEWRRKEEPFTRPTSKIALYPNKHDIILGRSKIAPTWPGNLMYNKLIESQAPRYVSVHGQNRVEKTLIAFQTIHVLRHEYGARFLSRKEQYWEAAEEAEVQPKVSQSLRVAARLYSQQQHYG